MAGSRGLERFLNNDKSQFDKEQTDLIKWMLNERYFKPWSLHHNQEITEETFNTTLLGESALEIFLTSTCNQNCEYCYLVKYDELYPKEFNNKETILKNLKILFNYIIEKDYYIPEIEFFTGEIWQSNFGLEVLEYTFEAICNGLRTDTITIPSNCSFILDTIQMHKIQHYIDIFEQHNVRLQFSISVDGLLLEEETRPLNNGIKRTEEFYDNLFIWAQHNNFLFHPMVSAYGIDKWIDNYKWWVQKCEEYNMNPDQVLMMLEVRNDNWSEQAIKDYNNFINYLLEEQFQKCNRNIELLAKKLFCYEGIDGGGYVPYTPAHTDTFPGCTVANTMTVRIGDLAICPCHRTAYDQFLYGRFIVKDDKIVDIEGYNPQIAMKILFSNFNLTNMGCDNCIYSPYCLKGCYGSQYESHGEIFMPIQNVCHFFFAKWNNIVKTYDKMGINKWLEENIDPIEMWYDNIVEWLDFCKEVRQIYEK